MNAETMLFAKGEKREACHTERCLNPVTVNSVHLPNWWGAKRQLLANTVLESVRKNSTTQHQLGSRTPVSPFWIVLNVFSE